MSVNMKEEEGPSCVFEVLAKKSKTEQSIDDAIDAYCPQRKYPDFFNPSEDGKKFWKLSWFDEQFLKLLTAIQRGSNIDGLVVDKLIEFETDGIFSMQIFSAELCEMILVEKDSFLSSGLPVFRPNSMNNYGIILNHIGMRHMLTELQQDYLLPISRLLFPIEASAFSNHHSFIVSYKPDQDTSLDMHTDASDITWNVCLGREGFEGSGLTFCGYIGEANHRQKTFQYCHALGRAVVHLGRRRHGADTIASGERHNLIIWNENRDYQQSEIYQHRQRQYEKEESEPHIECLSWTHDRDYGVYKDYPEGTSPYHHKQTERTANPWCPPQPFCYDQMSPIKARMLARLDKEAAMKSEGKELTTGPCPETVEQRTPIDVEKGP